MLSMMRPARPKPSSRRFDICMFGFFLALAREADGRNRQKQNPARLVPRHSDYDSLGALGYARPILARAFSVVNIHLMRAHAAFRCRCHAPISVTRWLGSSILRSRHWPRRTPISISTMLSQLACLGV